MQAFSRRLETADLHRLSRWNSCTIANAVERVSRADPLAIVNREETRDFMPEQGPIVGHAMTAVFSCNDEQLKRKHPDNFAWFRAYLASVPGPKIVVIRDADQPQAYGAIWGEVGAAVARTLGCVGSITDGMLRDLDEMKNVGFKALARGLAVSHAYSWPVRWGCDVEVFGTTVKPGQLIHADKHGFIVIPEDAQTRLLEAARFTDDLECETVITAARAHQGWPLEDVLRGMDEAARAFSARGREKYQRNGEW